MPLPKPRAGEDKKGFIRRCVSSEVTKREYPDNKQRVAVCHSQWRKHRQSEMKTEKIKVKAKDLTLLADGHLELVGDDAEFTRQEGNGEQRAAVKMVVRTNTAVPTYFGPMIHDFSGMFHKKKVTIDWSHTNDGSGPSQVIGYLDKFDVDSKRVECTGELVSVEKGDPASEVIRRLAANLPYESSIYFGGQGLELEEVAEGKSEKVNGSKFNGPGVIVRKWPLRGVAVCPYGRDNHTSVNLALGDDDVEILIHKQETNMSEEIENASGDAEANLIEKAAELVDAADELQSTTDELNEQIDDAPSGKDFIKAFGTKGAVWFAEGVSFTEASSKYTAYLEERVKALEDKLASLDLGGDEALDLGDVADDKLTSEQAAEKEKEVEQKEKANELADKIGPAAARFAASITLPLRKKN